MSLLEPLLIVGRRSDLGNLVFNFPFTMYKGGHPTNLLGAITLRRSFSLKKIPSLSLREEVSELSAPLSTPHSCVELPKEFYQRRSRNSSGASQFVMLWPVGVSPVRPPTRFYIFSSAILEVAYI
jgi:hypothetical protein